MFTKDSKKKPVAAVPVIAPAKAPAATTAQAVAPKAEPKEAAPPPEDWRKWLPKATQGTPKPKAP